MSVIDTNEKKKQKPVNKKIIELYEEQYHRGQEGFGIISVNKNGTIRLDRATEPAKFMYDLNTIKSPIIFAHHRTPTSTANKLGQTHPIFVSNKELKFDYYVMHNGVIRNSDELKKEHETKGYKYTTEIIKKGYNENYPDTLRFNDSESMAIEIVRYIEGLQRLVNFDGSATFLILQINKKSNKINKFYYGRHINPLNIHRKNGVITLASEGPGIELEDDIMYETTLKKNAKPKEYGLLFPVREIIPEREYKGWKKGKDGYLVETKNEIKSSSCTTWTEEDEKEMKEYNEGYGIYTEEDMPTIATQRAEAMYEEICTIVDDFCICLEDEESAYLADVEHSLKQVKVILKEAKGETIQYFRELKAEKKETKDTELEAMGYKLPPVKVEHEQSKIPFVKLPHMEKF